jgi:hypothetical protein
MNAHDVNEVKVYALGDRAVIHVPGGRGEELRIHLESHGILSVVRPAAQAPYERLELGADVDLVALQALVDQWER